MTFLGSILKQGSAPGAPYYTLSISHTAQFCRNRSQHFLLRDLNLPLSRISSPILQTYRYTRTYQLDTINPTPTLKIRSISLDASLDSIDLDINRIRLRYQSIQNYWFKNTILSRNKEQSQFMESPNMFKSNWFYNL